METEVRVYGGASSALRGRERLAVSFDGSTLGELLAAIKKSEPALTDFIDGPMAGTIVLLLNGTALEPPNPALKLKSGDILSIMPFVAGG